MKRFGQTIIVLGTLILGGTLSSCTNNDDNLALLRPTALVTVRPAEDGAFTMQLDNTTVLYPSNMKSSPFGDKEVRALVNYTDEGGRGNARSVRVNWMDSIRTKRPVPDLGTENDDRYGNDAVEIVKDWVTVAEDGYLTLRIRTRWGAADRKHYINLLTGSNPDDPYEVELRHDANGDTGGSMGDALIAFNLNGLTGKDGQDVKLKLNWKSYGGPKSAVFDLRLRPRERKACAADIGRNRCVE